MREMLVLELGSGRRIGYLKLDFKALRRHQDPMIRVRYYIPTQGGDDIPLAYSRQCSKLGDDAKVLWCKPGDVVRVIAEVLYFRPERCRELTAQEKYQREKHKRILGKRP